MKFKFLAFLKKVYSDQKGMSLPLVIISTTIAISGILYVSLNLIPKLQEEKKKTQSVVAYRIFVSGITDYIVHGIRERWCVNTSTAGKKKKIITSDLLLSNDCSSTIPMEKVVTYQGNLERLLWDANVIGQKGIYNCDASNRPAPEASNTILAMNCLRYLDGKTATKLTYDDVDLVDGKITLNLTKEILEDMTDQHPLFIITKDVRQCIKSVNITLERIMDIDNAPQGEEKKIGITVETSLYKTKLSCLFLREVSSKSYYTFYPRRLHNFSLIKYGDLDAKLPNDFHAPVYVAGDLKLPLPTANKDETTIFYDNLTLGTFNSGSPQNIMRNGKIKNEDGTDYTFEERGDPYLGKQDSYPGFRGILGGLRLDAVEDKGFYNLFDYTTQAGGSVATLEQCIDENQVTTKPSYNKDSVLAYTAASYSGNDFTVKVGLTEKNRFKLTKTAPSVTADHSHGATTTPGINFRIVVPPPPNGTKSLGSFRITDSGDVYSATIGVGSQINFILNIESFGINATTLATYKTKADPVTKTTYSKVFPVGHVLEDLPENTTFIAKAKALADKCDIALSNDCVDLGYATGSAIYTTELNAFKAAQTALKNKLDDLKTKFLLPEEAQTVFAVENLPLTTEGKLIINQKTFKASQTDKWKAFAPVVKISKVSTRFQAYHYGTQNLTLEGVLHLAPPTGATIFQLKKQDDGALVNFNSANWSDAEDNQTLPYMKLLKEIKPPIEIVELDCPDGMGLADWDLDMSESTNFAWNYANTPVGVIVDSSDHSPIPEITFTKPTATNLEQVEGYIKSSSKSVVKKCIIPPDRTHVYGLYVCNELLVKARSTDLYMIGTFIVQNLNLEGSGYRVKWHSLWTPAAADMIMKDFNNPPGTTASVCDGIENKTLKDLYGNPLLEKTLKQCSPQEIIMNGPNNFTWTTIDPNIGLAQPTDVMTSQKSARPRRIVVNTNSREDIVR